MANYQLTYTGAELQTILDSVSDKVDKVEGKGLSTNDFTNAYKANVDILSQVSKTIYVDKNRTDSYTEDGTYSKPYKTIMGVINYVASLDYNGYINIEINNGIYNENIVLEDSALKYIVFTGKGYVSINPSSGNALQSITDNDNLYALHISNIIFSKPIVLTGSDETTAFSDVIFENVMFNGTATITATCINNITMKNCYDECDISLTNTAYCYLESFQVQGNLTLSADDTADIPSGGGNTTIIANGIYFSGAPTYSIGGTSTITLAILGSRWGKIADITLTENVTLYAYSSFIRGTTTNNGAIILRGGSTLEGYVAGTGTLTLTGNDCKYNYYDNSISGLTSSTVQTAIDEVVDNAKYHCDKIYSQYGDVTVTNTTDETSLIDTESSIGSLTISANTLDVGDILCVRGFGHLSATAGSHPTLKMTFGDTILFTNQRTTASPLTDMVCDIILMITIRATGESGSCIINGSRDIMSTNGSTISKLPIHSETAITIDTTVDNVVDITYKWETADEDNNITIQSGYLTKM